MSTLERAIRDLREKRDAVDLVKEATANTDPRVTEAARLFRQSVEPVLAEESAERQKSAVAEAELSLAKAKARTPADIIRKFGALLSGRDSEDIDPDAMAALVREAVDMSETLGKPDPMVGLVERWKVILGRERKCWEADGSGECPTSAYVIKHRMSIEQEIASLIPKSAEGVAALAEFVWLDQHDTLAGSELWESHLDKVEIAALGNLANGAAIVAGTCD